MSETQALLQHDDSPTAIVSRKLRSLMQYNALQQGYMPSTSQVEEHLAAVVQSPLLNSRQRGLSRQTKTVLDDTKAFVKALAILTRDKNQGDLIQEIIWNLRGASASAEVDGDVFATRLDAATARADAKTAHVKAKAVADVLYSNPQFRALIHDGSILARDILSDVVEATATAIAPEEADLIELEEEATDVDGRAIKDDVDDTKKVINDNVEFAKQQIKETYDEATTTAIETLRDLQRRGQKFGVEIQNKAGQVAQQAQDAANNVVTQSKDKADEIAKSISQSADQAITKLAEVTGHSEAEIRDKLNNGISVDELMAMARSAGEAASQQARETAARMDKKGGELINQASTSAADFADRNDVKGKINSAAKQSQSVAQDVKKSTDSGIKQIQSKSREVNDNVQETATSAAESAGDTFEGVAAEAKGQAANAKGALQQQTIDAKGTVQTKVQQGQEATAQAKDTAITKAQKVKDNSTKQLDASTMLTATKDGATSGNHLQEIGIIHPDSSSGVKSDGIEANSNPDYRDLLQAVIQKLKTQIDGVQGISAQQLEQAARELIETASAKGNDIQARVKEAAAKADKKGGEYIQKASDQVGNATDKAAETANDGKEKLTEASEQAKSTASETIQETTKSASAISQSAKDKGDKLATAGKQRADEAAGTASDLAQSAAQSANSLSKNTQDKFSQIMQEVDNIDTTDLQEAVNNLLRTAKQVLEEKTGATAADARQSLDWAIKRGEELAEQAMKKGREGTQQAQEQASQYMAVAQEKSQQAGEAAQNTLVTVGAQAKHALQNAPRDAAGQIHDTLDASQALVDTAVEAIQESTSEIRDYLSQKFPPKRRQAIQKHFQGLAVALRDNSDYSNGLDGLISIGRKYVDYTLTFTEEVPTDASEIVSTNSELDTAVKLTLQLIERFSNGVGFGGVQSAYTKLKKDMQKEQGSGDFLDDCMKYFKRIVQDMKYASSKDAEKHGNLLLQRVDEFTEETGFKQDVNSLIQEVVRLAEGFANDKVLFNVISKGQTCFKHLVMNEYGNFVFKKRVMKDFFNIIVPSALKLVQYIPISRIEFQNADVDVLIENLVFESSASHDQSFLPYRLKIDNHNQIEFLNAYKFESDYSNEVTVKIQGLTLAVRDAGFYIRKKTGFWRFMDTGLVDLIMDGPGIDIDIDLAMSTDDEENDVTKDALFIVKDVRVNVRNLDFSTSGTRHGWLVGLFKPFLRGFIKRQVGLAVAAAMKEQLIYYEYQLRMLQHRFRTAYIANNGQASFESFFRAVFTANAGNNAGRKGQFEVVIGSQGPLAGIFTKASLQQELEESDAIAREHGRPHSWQNDIFDL